MLRGGYHGRYQLSGHLAYMHDGSPFVAPFDLKRLDVVGAPVRVLDRVWSNALSGGAEFSTSERGH